MCLGYRKILQHLSVVDYKYYILEFASKGGKIRSEKFVPVCGCACRCVYFIYFKESVGRTRKRAKNKRRAKKISE